MSKLARLDLVKRCICTGMVGWNGKCFDLFHANKTIPAKYRTTDLVFKTILREHVHQEGVDPKSREEHDPDWLRDCPDDPWWYFVIVPVPEIENGIFAKMKLFWDEGSPEDDAYVELISVHESAF